jgi:TPR repeat protein
MNYSAVALALVSATIASFNAYGASVPSPVPTPPSPVPVGVPPPACMNCDLELPRQEIPGLKVKALSGDGVAAEKLARFYGFVLMSSADEYYWATVAAEDGNPKSEYNLGVLLSSDTKHQNRTRAIFWLERARAAGVTGCEGVSYPRCVGELKSLQRR